MTLSELQAQVALGEDSRRQFKQDLQNPDALAAEMAAFANSDGGVPALRESSEKSLEKSSEKSLSLVRIESTLSAREIALRLGITPRAVEKQIAKLRKDGRLERVGSAKGGHWHVIES